MLQPDGNVFQNKIVLSGTNVDSNLSNQPMLLRETDVPLIAGLIFGAAKSDGGDIRFYEDEAGTNSMGVDIQAFDPVARTFVIWFKPSTVLSGGTTIYITYGNPALNIGSTSGCWVVYKDVYHCEETTGDLLSSSSSGDDWTPNGTSPNAVTGLFGDAQDFNGTSDYFKAKASLMPSGTTSFSWSLWVKTTQTSQTGAQWWAGTALIDADQSGGAPDWGISMEGGATAVAAMGLGTPDVTLKGTTQINDGNWHYITCVFNTNNGTSRLFVDGVQEASGVLSNDGARNNNFPTMGRNQPSAGDFYDGLLDEVRVIHSEISIAKHKAEYLFATDPASNITVDPAVWVGELDYNDSILKTEGPSGGVTGEVTYTDPNNSDLRVPTAIIVYGNSTSDYTDGNNTSLRQSWGMSDGSGQRLFYSGTQNGQTTSKLGRFTVSDSIYGLTSVTGQGLNNKAKVVEFGPNEVVLNWTNVTFSTRNITIKFIYGVPATLKTLTPNTSVNGTANNDDLAFKPNLVYAMSLRDGIDGSSTSGDGWSLGFATNYKGLIQQGCNTRNAQGNVNPAVVRGVISDTYIVSEIFNDQSDDYDLELTSWDSLGATFTTRNLAPNSNRRVVMLYLGMPSNQHARVNFNQVPSGTGNKSFTGLGFQPDALHRLSGDLTNFDSPDSAEASGWMHSMFDVDDQVAFSFRNEHSVSPSALGCRAHTKSIYYRNQGDTLQHDGTFVSMDGDGWTENFTTGTDVTAQVVLALKYGKVLKNARGLPRQLTRGLTRGLK